MLKRRRESETEMPADSPAASSSAPVDNEGDRLLKVPQKRFYRQRAHANVFVDHRLDYPTEPMSMDWTPHFPGYATTEPGKIDRKVEFADVGCGFGGLLMALAPQYPETLMLGMEIRPSVTQYVHDRILAFRQLQSRLPADGSTDEAVVARSTAQPRDTSSNKAQTEEEHLADLKPPPHRVPGQFQNVSVIRANAMKHLPNFFGKAQLSKIFFLFPDPHFKRSKHKARIITTTLLAEYAFILRPGGSLYTVTDVKDLHDWMMLHLMRHPLFEYIPTQELLDAKDPVLHAAMTSTEEGKKVARNQGDKYAGCFRRRESAVVATAGGVADVEASLSVPSQPKLFRRSVVV